MSSQMKPTWIAFIPIPTYHPRFHDMFTDLGAHVVTREGQDSLLVLFPLRLVKCIDKLVITDEPLHWGVLIYKFE